MLKVYINKKAGAYITVSVSLIMGILLSFILVLFKSAGMGYSNLRAEATVEICNEAVLGEYHKELFDRFGLLLLDTSYKSGEPKIENVKERIKEYADKNLRLSMSGRLMNRTSLVSVNCVDVDISSYRLAADGDGEVFRDQILKYMCLYGSNSYIGKAYENVGVLKEKSYDTTDIEEKRRNNLSELDLYINDEGKEKLSEEAPIIEEIKQTAGKGLLEICHPDVSSISSVSCDLSKLASKRNLMHGNKNVRNSKESIKEMLLIDMYILQKCGRYSKENEESLLKYQVEYICAGNGSDKANLSEVAATIFFWREASNFAYIVNDREKCTVAETIGAAVALLCLEPSLEGIVKNAVLLSWSFSESVSDMNILFKGGKVPLVKDKDSWKTGKLQMPFFDDKTSGKGLDYTEYLAMLLLTTGYREKIYRLMDIMEMDIRQTKGNENFQIDGCMESATANIAFESSVGYRSIKVKEIGYNSRDGE